jgi:hypothetical protein
MSARGRLALLRLGDVRAVSEAIDWETMDIDPLKQM